MIDLLRLWFAQEGRTYPWSITTDPYKIWISEVMLQQTVVQAVFNYYQRWIDRWPDVRLLTQVQEEDVLRAWEGLGYYQRGRNLYKAARIIVENGYENLPADENFLKTLPGMGDYTRAAVLSFAYDLPFLALDANLKRVFQRLEGRPEWDSEIESKVKSAFLSEEGVFHFFSSREFNTALMQLGQLVCLPRSPRCEACPLTCFCQAHKLNKQHLIPLRKVKTTTEKITNVGLYFKKNDHESVRDWEIFLARPLKGRFSHLWLFPPSEEEGKFLSQRIHYYTRYKDRLKPRMIFSNNPVLPSGWTGFWTMLSKAETLGMPSVYRLIYREALTVLTSV